MTKTESFPLQVLRFPVLIWTPATGWWKHPVAATSWEGAMHQVAKSLKPGETLDIEDTPFNSYHPA